MTKSKEIPVLETDRLILLPWKLEYAKEMLLFASNKNVINISDGWKIIDNIKKAEKKIQGFINNRSPEWAIAVKVNGEPKIIGSIGMHIAITDNLKSLGIKTKISKDNVLKIQFGYLIAEEYWGQGITPEAVQRIMKIAFMELKCDVMITSHRESNIQSKRVIEKCNFKFRGIFRKNCPNDPKIKISYYHYHLLRDDYLSLYKINSQESENDIKSILEKYNLKYTVRDEKSITQKNQVKSSPYSQNKPIKKITEITYIKEPTGYLCGQTCVAMLADVSVDEIIKIIGTDRGTTKQDLKKALDYYGIRYAPKSTKYDPSIPLPNLCIIRMLLSGYGHWGIYHNGFYYDPQFGKLKECPPNAKIFQVWEIYP